MREPRLEDLAIGIGQPDLLRAGGGLRGADLRHPRQRDHQGIEIRHPRQRDLERRRVVPGSHLAERGIGSRPWRGLAPAERAVGQEPDLVADAVLHHAAQDGAVVPHAQLVLHGVDVGDAPRLLDLADGDVAQPDRLDQPCALQRRQRAHARRQRHAWIDGVELVEIDRVDAEGAATALARLGEVFGPAIGLPSAVRPRDAALGRDGETRAIAGPAPDRPRQQPLVVAEVLVRPAIRVGRVEEGDAGVQRRMQHRHGSLVVASRVGREAHAADGDHPKRRSHEPSSRAPSRVRAR